MILGKITRGTKWGTKRSATRTAMGAACVATLLAGAAHADSGRIGALLNAERQAHNVPQVTEARRLNAAAQSHADYMARTGQFSHTGQRGSGVGDRMRRQGYCFRMAAENIAYGYDDMGQLMQGWMDSPGHRSNNLHEAATEYGFAKSGIYSVLVLGRPC
jgi:uncharacterized protein YkwD